MASRLLKTHGKLWYDAAIYRWSWIVLPQAVALTLMGLFVMDGGLATLFSRSTTPFENTATRQWGRPTDNNSAAAFVPLRDKAGREGNMEALAALEKVAASGNVDVSFLLGTLYDPAANFPYPKAKDANRALNYYLPAVKAKNFDAQYNAILSYTAEQSTTYNLVAACELTREISKHPDFIKGINKPEYDWLRLTVADCFAGGLRPKNSAFVEINKADAEAAIALYQEPRLIDYLGTKRAVAKMHLRYSSPVFDFARGCNVARRWVDQATTSNYTFEESDRWLLPTAAGCLLNIFRPAGVQYTVPSIADQNKAVVLLEQPILKDDAFAQRVSALAYVNDGLAIKDLEKAQEKARAWARNPTPETDLPVDSVFFVYVADSLMGIAGGAKPNQPDQTDINIARNLYTRVAEAGDPIGWHRMGLNYERGVAGWAKDMNKARQAYEKCKNELVACKERLGVFQDFGLGVNKNHAEALKLYRECSNTGSAFCDTRLAVFHFEGLGGLQRNPVLAAKYARKAAEGGNGAAAELYSVFLYNGTGIASPDYSNAARWMVIAIQRNQSTLPWLREGSHGINNPAFWISFHHELRASAVYYGPISGTPTAATFEAAAKLVSR